MAGLALQAVPGHIGGDREGERRDGDEPRAEIYGGYYPVTRR